MKTGNFPCMMLQGIEDDLMNAPVDIASPNSVIVGEILPLAIPNSVAMSNSSDQSHIAAGFPIFSTLRESTRSTLTSADNHIVNQLEFMGPTPVSAAMQLNNVGDVVRGCLSPSGNAEFHDQLAGGIPVYQSTSLAPMNDFLENTKDSAFSDTQFQQVETFRTCILHSSSKASNSSFASSLNCEGDEALCNVNKWESDRFHSIQQLARENPERSDFQPISSMENLNQNGWMPSSTTNSKLWNELSLSLSTSPPVIIRGTNFMDQYSQLTGVTQSCMKSTELGSHLNSCNSRDLTQSYGSGSPAHLSQAIAGSRYLSVIQDILSQIASYPLESLDQVTYSTTTIGFVPFSSSSLEDTTSQFGSDVIGRSDSPMEPQGKKLSGDAKKSHLLTLLQLIDDRYTQCLDEIHTVVSAFHAVTDLDPRLHTRYTLQTITSVYRKLREKITKCIFAIGVHSNTMCTKENEESFETTFIQKQWALQQLKRKDNQLWRPQRGLPERSVSVLRAWMFQNFLHPYPKDTEKHLLAVKSGLTRNQVSNWFINARVRLWKPMIEEMYAEMSRRKSSRNEEGFERIRRSHISISSEKI